MPGRNESVERLLEMCAEQGLVVYTINSNCTNGIVPIAEAWGIRSGETRTVNVLQMKCLRSLVGLSRMNIVRNEEVRRRAETEKEL